MKKHYLIIILITIASCNKKAKESEVISNGTQQKLEKAKEVKKTKDRIEILPIKANMTEVEIASSHFVSDTLTKDFNMLIGTTDKWTNVLPVMFPATYEGQLSGTFQLEDSIKLISFFTDGDMEEQIFTKWLILPDSTLSYLGRLKPKLNSKYSFATIYEKVEISKEQYFIGSTGGGEGGEIWQSIWTAKYNGNDKFDKIDHYETGYNDGENIRTLKYTIDKNRLSIILKIDSLIYEMDSLMQYPLTEKVVKTVSLE